MFSLSHPIYTQHALLLVFILTKLVKRLPCSSPWFGFELGKFPFQYACVDEILCTICVYNFLFIRIESPLFHSLTHCLLKVDRRLYRRCMMFSLFWYGKKNNNNNSFFNSLKIVYVFLCSPTSHSTKGKQCKILSIKRNFVLSQYSAAKKKITVKKVNEQFFSQM